MSKRPNSKAKAKKVNPSSRAASKNESKGGILHGISRTIIKAEESVANYFEGFKTKDYVIGAMLFILIAVIPLIVKYAARSLGTSEQYAYNYDTTAVGDLFAYYKSVLFVLIMLSLVIIEIIFVLTEDINADLKKIIKRPINIAVFSYVVMVILSSLLSNYQDLAYLGGMTYFESAFVLVGYMVLFVIIKNFARSEKHNVVILSALLFSGLIISFIGLSELFGFDILNIKFIRFMIYGSEVADVYKLAPFANAFSTLGTPAALGLYTAMILPFSFVLGLFLPRKSPMKYMFIILTVLSVFSLAGSESAGGLIGTVFGLAAAAALASVVFIKYKKIVPLISGVIVVVAVLVVSAIMPGSYVAKALEKFSNSSADYFIKDMVSNGENVTFETKMGTLAFMNNENGEYDLFLNNELLIPDESETIYDDAEEDSDNSADAGLDALSGIVSEEDLALEAEQIEQLDSEQSTEQDLEQSTEQEQVGSALIKTYNFGEYGDFMVMDSNDSAGFTIQYIDGLLMYGEYEGSYYLIDNFGYYRAQNLSDKVKTFGFKGMEGFASDRGYIWSRTFPMLVNKAIIGSGPDSFIMEYPNLDLLGKLIHLGTYINTIDRPSNVFLQVAVNTGVVSLIALLALIAFCLIDMTKSVWKKTKPSSDYSLAACLRDNAVSIACFAGAVGYIVAALATNSVVSVTFIFWAILGLGVAQLTDNKVIKRKRRNKTTI